MQPGRICVSVPRLYGCYVAWRASEHSHQAKQAKDIQECPHPDGQPQHLHGRNEAYAARQGSNFVILPALKFGMCIIQSRRLIL